MISETRHVQVDPKYVGVVGRGHCHQRVIRVSLGKGGTF